MSSNVRMSGFEVDFRCGRPHAINLLTIVAARKEMVTPTVLTVSIRSLASG